MMQLADSSLAVLGQLSANLSHEVRTSLAAIALYASMLERDLAERPRERELVRKISGAARSLDRLVSEILDFSLEGVLECQETSCGAVLQPVLEAMAPWLDEREIVVRQTLGTDEVPIWCDVSRMQHAILNILLNAALAMGDRRQIVISAARTQGGARIVASNTAPGISDDRIRRVFDPFCTTPAGGPGWGLATVHQMVAAHGGRVSVSHQAGGGVILEVQLPDRLLAGASSAEPNRRSAGGVAVLKRERFSNRLAS